MRGGRGGGGVGGGGAISIYWKNSNPFALFHYKIKLNYTGVDIKRVFFQDTKSLLTKH